MPFSEEKHAQILSDLISVFQARYGDAWRTKLRRNLKPSPLQDIAEQRGVSLTQVRKVRSQLLRVGMVFEAVEAAYSESLTQPQLGESQVQLPIQ
jgi:hypothetical protein